jgi:NAD+ synthase (glutamine-hydrolysing)
MKITVLQSNFTIADFRLAVSKLSKAVAHAQTSGSAMVVTSELFLCGYPPKDLLLEPSFWMSLKKALDDTKALSAQYPDIAIVVGSPYRVKPKIYNAVLVFLGGELVFKESKSLFPNYDVFDEARYFSAAPSRKLWSFKGKNWGFLVCEDSWNGVAKTYTEDPVTDLVEQGADVLVNISASPFEEGKPELRHQVFSEQAKQHRIPVVMVNQIGFQDELIFDGGSFACNAHGNLIAQAPFFDEAMLDIDLFLKKTPDIQPVFYEETEARCRALVLGIKDYVTKTGFKEVVLGLSGGIDSAVTAALAVEALGAFNVTGLLMPSPYSSWGSIADAQELAKHLGIKTYALPIKTIFEPVLNLVEHTDGIGSLTPLATENLQARIRGTLLMAYANHTNALVLSTGNKSELAVGYCTLYGDMNGALSVLADVYKTQVYQLAEFINRDQIKIPLNSIQKPPSAELRPNQKDQDTLPEYAVLDHILTELIENRTLTADIVAAGYDKTVVEWVDSKIKQNEYKRKQAAMGIRVSGKAFGMGRRIPILKV